MELAEEYRTKLLDAVADLDDEHHDDVSRGRGRAY